MTSSTKKRRLTVVLTTAVLVVLFAALFFGGGAGRRGQYMTTSEGLRLYRKGHELTLYGYFGSDETVVIPEGVTAVTRDAFYGCETVKEIVFPASMRHFGGTFLPHGEYLADEDYRNVSALALTPEELARRDAFGAPRLTSLTVAAGNPVYDSVSGCLIERTSGTVVLGSGASVIPDDGTIRRIASGAFRGARDLVTLSLPEGILEIGAGAFYDCDALTAVRIPKSVQTIGRAAFSVPEGTVSSLSTLEIAADAALTEIGADAFRRTAITAATLPDGLSSLGAFAFAECASLSSVRLSALSSFSPDILTGCPSLTTVTMAEGGRYVARGNCILDPESHTVVFGSAGSEIPADLGALFIGDGAFAASGIVDFSPVAPISGIGDRAFAECAALVSVTLPGTVQAISDYAFADCPSLATLTLGEGVASIGVGAFRDNAALTALHLPASLTTIGDGAFVGCAGLVSLTAAEENTRYRAENNCILERTGGVLVLGCRTSVIPEGVTTIGAFAFRDCTGLTALTIQTGVTVIERGAFLGCTGLGQLTFADPNGWTVEQITIPAERLGRPNVAAGYATGPYSGKTWVKK